jgi:hypothetical protein
MSLSRCAELRTDAALDRKLGEKFLIRSKKLQVPPFFVRS